MTVLVALAPPMPLPRGAGRVVRAVGRALALPLVVVFPLWFFRYSRSLWLALEYLVNPEP